MKKCKKDRLAQYQGGGNCYAIGYAWAISSFFGNANIYLLKRAYIDPLMDACLLGHID